MYVTKLSNVFSSASLRFKTSEAVKSVMRVFCDILKLVPPSMLPFCIQKFPTIISNKYLLFIVTLLVNVVVQQVLLITKVIFSFSEVEF